MGLGGLGSFSQRFIGTLDEVAAARTLFTFSGVGAAKPGQIPLIDPTGAQIFAPNMPAPWNGNYEVWENGGAGSTSQGLHEYLTAPVGTGAARTTLQGERGWFQNPCAIETGTTTTGSMAINTAGSNAMFAGAATGTLFHESTFSIPVLSTGTDRFAIGFGFQDSTNPFVINNGACIRYRDDNNGGKLELCTAAAGVRSTLDTGITLVAGSYYRVRVELLNNTTARFWIKTIWDSTLGSPAYTDDGIWGNPTWTLSTNIPSGTGQGFTSGSFIIKSAGTTSCKMKIGFNKGGRVPTFAGNPLVTGPEGYTVGTDETGAPGYRFAPHRIPAPIVFYAYDRGGYTPSGGGIDFGSDAGGGGTQVLAAAIDDGQIGATGLFSGSSSTGWSFRRTAFNLNLDASVDPMVIEGLWRIPTLSTGAQKFVNQFGLLDVAATAPLNSITIDIDSNANAHAQCVCQSGGVSTTVDSGITVVAGTYYFARIIITPTGVDFYFGADGAGALTKVATITTNIPTGTKNMAAALGVRKSVGVTSLNIQYNYIFAYQRSTTWVASGTNNAMGLQVAPHSQGLSRSTANGPYAPGERVIMEDNNSGVAGGAPVITFAPWNPRTHNFALEQTAHMNLWGSSDLNAIGDETGSDLTHPNCWTFGASAAVGHVAVGNAGGVAIIVLSATSHQRIVDFKFQIPTLSDGTTTFNGRFGLASVTFGSPVHGVYAEIDSNTNAHMQFVTRAASVETRTDSGITIVAGTWYRGRIVITKNTQVDYYLAAEGSPLPSSPIATITTNIPSGTGQALLPNFVVEMSAGATSRKIPVNHYLFGMDRYAA